MTTATKANPAASEALPVNPTPTPKAKAKANPIADRDAAIRGTIAALALNARTADDADKAIGVLIDALSATRKVDRSATLSVDGRSISPQSAILALLGSRGVATTRSTIAKAARDSVKL